MGLLTLCSCHPHKPRSQNQPPKTESLSPESTLVQGGEGRIYAAAPMLTIWVDSLHLVEKQGLVVAPLQ